MKLQESIVAPIEITVEPLPQPADKAAWDAALASAREAGYRQGFQDGFLSDLQNAEQSESCGREPGGCITYRKRRSGTFADGQSAGWPALRQVRTFVRGFVENLPAL